MNRERQAKSAKGGIILMTVILALLVSVSCRLTTSNVDIPDYRETIAVQSTRIANLSTQVAGQEDVNQSQWELISHLATQMPYALDLITPVPGDVTITPTPFPKCTPPSCEAGEVYHCPDECPGGCGTTCATPTPGG